MKRSPRPAPAVDDGAPGAGVGGKIDPGASRPPPDTEREGDGSLVGLLGDLFLGRSSTTRKLQSKDKETWTAEPGPSEADFEAHVAGERRCGPIPFVDEEHVGWACIDWDFKNWSAFKGWEARGSDAEGKAHGAILRVVAELALRDIRVHVEKSRNKGFHGWIFFAEPAAASAVREFLLPVALKAGAEDGVDLVCPRTATRGGVGNGSFAPLFGGDKEGHTRFHHQVDGRWVPVEDQAAYLRAILDDLTPASAIPPAGEQPCGEPSPERPAPAVAERESGTIAEGERNATLASWAGSLRHIGLETSEIEAALHEINRARCPKPLPRREVAKIATSIGRKPAGPVPSANIVDAIARLNAEWAFAMQGPNSTLLWERSDPETRRTIVEFVRPESFRLKYAPETIEVETKKGKVRKGIAEIWLSHPERRSYEQIIFIPGQTPPNCYNLWRGFAVEPRPGECRRYLDHLRQNICSGDDSLYRWLLAWMAQAVQEPAVRPGTAVVVRGGQGTGKGIFARFFAELFGDHFLQVTHGRHLVGNFNAHLRDCLVIWGDEAFWAGDKQHEGVLKALVTEPYLMLEAKGKDAVRWPNRVRLIMSSNEDWVVPAGVDERRFAMFDVGETHKQDRNYFGAIVAEMENGGRSALLHHLLHEVDWRAENVAAIPRTEALARQQMRSWSPIRKWWHEVLLEADPRTWSEFRSRADVHDAYSAFCDRARIREHSRDAAFRDQWRRWIPHVGRAERREAGGARRRGYCLPRLDLCREAFERDCGLVLDWGPVLEEVEAGQEEMPF